MSGSEYRGTVLPHNKEYAKEIKKSYHFSKNK